MNKLKVLHITHIDLDGYGCIPLIRRMFKDLFSTEVDYITVDYGFEEDNSISIMDKILNYDTIIFSDISFSEKFAKKLNTLRNEYKKTILLLDHHKSAITKLINLDYNWMILDTSKSGTLLCYEYVEKVYKSYGRLQDILSWREFSILVDDYDRWVHNDYKSTRLQFLWSGMDKFKFLERFTNNPSMEFCKEEEDIIKISESKLEESINIMNSKIEYHTDIDGFSFGLVPKTDFYSLAADRLLNIHNIDYLVLIDGNNLSFRSKRINVLPICEALGGGGHEKACGVSLEPLTNIVESIKNREIKHYSFVDKFKKL